MPFGLKNKNAKATYQRLVKSKAASDHVKDLEQTVTVLRQYQ